MNSPRLFDVLRNRGGPTKVYGRDEELGLVQDAFDRVAEDECQSSEVVLVHGPSGCGKSAIVKELKQWTKDECGDVIKTFFGTGKYDQLVNNEPFAAIVAASNELCENVLKAGPHIVKRFNDRFKSMVDGDATVLSNAIPGLAKLLREGSKKNIKKGKTGTSDQTQDMATATQAFTRFKQLWRNLLLAIACCTDVVVLFLDDVQWADANSLDLIHTMTKVTRARNIMFVCAFRDDTTVAKAQLERIRWCFSLEDKQSELLDAGTNSSRRLSTSDSTKLTVPLVDIALDNFDDRATVKFIMGILYGDQDKKDNDNGTIDKNRVVELSVVLHDHTNGNAFFILHYLDYLSNIGLLRSNDDGMSWEWDLSAIVNQSHVPESIADLLSRVIDRLSDDSLQVLTVGAHVGFEFSSDLFQQDILANHLTMISKTTTTDTENTNTPGPSVAVTSIPECSNGKQTNITTLLEAAIQEGLLEDNGHGAYAFPHDQIQQALYSRLTKRRKEQQELHLCIGKAMLHIVEADQTRSNGLASGISKSNGRVDTTLFVAVDNMNKGSDLIDNREDRNAITRLNYDAAQAALGKSAIEGAVQYIRAAVALLPPDCWQFQYELALDIYSLAARLEHNVGNASRCGTLLDEIQANARTVFDRLPSYFIEIDMLGAERRLHDALALGSLVLKELGESVSAKPGTLAMILELRRTTKLMNKTKASGFANLGLMTDPKKVAAMSVLSSMFVLSYIIGTANKNLTAITALRMVKISCKHGMAPQTPFGVAAVATIQLALGDYAGAKELSTIAFDLFDRIPGADAIAGRTKSILYGLVSPWLADKSLADIHPEYIRCFHGCMAYGDIDQGFFTPLHHLCMGLVRGTPIEELNVDFEKYIKAMDEYQSNQTMVFTLAYWRFARVLIGKGDRTVKGDNLDVTGLHKRMKEVPKSDMMVYIDIVLRTSGRILLGTYGDQLREDERHMAFVMKNFHCPRTHFLRAFCDLVVTVGSTILHKKTGKRKYYRFQNKMIKVLEKYYKGQAPIAMGPYLLAAAEAMANKPRRKTWEDFQQAYLEAIEAARHFGGFIFVEAYGYEKLAKLAEDRSDRPKVTYYLKEALATYTRWGATVKIDDLTERLAVRRQTD